MMVSFMVNMHMAACHAERAKSLSGKRGPHHRLCPACCLPHVNPTVRDAPFAAPINSMPTSKSRLKPEAETGTAQNPTGSLAHGLKSWNRQCDTHPQAASQPSISGQQSLHPLEIWHQCNEPQ
ncbi:MAG: hypothetical protein Q4A97_05770 [Comamonadaceae bacterium]|nr:hypothetical protein [Comamonadaceae bacterium]